MQTLDQYRINREPGAVDRLPLGLHRVRLPHDSHDRTGCQREPDRREDGESQHQPRCSLTRAKPVRQIRSRHSRLLRQATRVHRWRRTVGRRRDAGSR